MLRNESVIQSVDASLAAPPSGWRLPAAQCHRWLFGIKGSFNPHGDCGCELWINCTCTCLQDNSDKE